MKPNRIAFFTIIILFACNFYTKAQVADEKDSIPAVGNNNTIVNIATCNEKCSSLLLNSVKEKKDWQIVSGPDSNIIHYPVPAFYTKPFSSWEMDRYTADSSYFKDCDWMVLPDKRKVFNTVSRRPIVFVKKFTTVMPSKLKLIVKMLYDNMAYLYIDSNRIVLNHRIADINRFIKQVSPELSSFVSIPATFNFSYNASFYAGNYYNLVLPAGNHVIRIELFNNANELGCIIKGILMSENGGKIFCDTPIKDEQAELESILTYNEKRAFGKNDITDTLYDALMQTVKKGYWINNLIKDDRDIISNDTLYIKKGEKINVMPAYVTEFRNGNLDTVLTKGSLKKIAAIKVNKKQWEGSFVFDASSPGLYLLEIDCEMPADNKRKAFGIINKYTRVIKVK